MGASSVWWGPRRSIRREAPTVSRSKAAKRRPRSPRASAPPAPTRARSAARATGRAGRSHPKTKSSTAIQGWRLLRPSTPKQLAGKQKNESAASSASAPKGLSTRNAPAVRVRPPQSTPAMKTGSANRATTLAASGTIGPMYVKKCAALTENTGHAGGRVPGARPCTVAPSQAPKSASEGTNGTSARARARASSKRKRSQRTPASRRSCANISECQRWSAHAIPARAAPRRHEGASNQRTAQARPSTSSGAPVANAKKPPMTQYEITSG